MISFSNTTKKMRLSVKRRNELLGRILHLGAHEATNSDFIPKRTRTSTTNSNLIKSHCSQLTTRRKLCMLFTCFILLITANLLLIPPTSLTLVAKQKQALKIPPAPTIHQPRPTAIPSHNTPHTSSPPPPSSQSSPSAKTPS